MAEFLSPEPRVRIVTLNCWGLWMLSKHRVDRIAAIAAHLQAHPEYDVVALQEVWVHADFEVLRQAVAQNLPHYKNFYSGTVSGPGLVVLSRWPIKSVWLHTYPLSGRPSAVWRGDWYVGKSTGAVTIDHPSGVEIEVLNTHMHAEYGPGDSAYNCHRASQVWDLMRLAQRAKDAGRVVFVVGDFNCRPGTLHYSLFRLLGNLSDAWVALNGEFDGDLGSLTPEEQIELAGVTSDSQLITWNTKPGLESAQRLDYVLFDESRATVHHCKVVFTEQIQGLGSMSDHFGVEAEFTLEGGSPAPAGLAERLKAIEELLVTISLYRSVSVWQMQWRLAHGTLSAFAFVGLLAGLWFVPRIASWVCFVVAVGASVVLVTGLVNGLLLGLLFGLNEWRALNEFEDQVWLARRQLESEAEVQEWPAPSTDSTASRRQKH